MRPTRNELDQSLITGAVWSGAAKWTAQAIAWAVTILVARLLTPEDYGLVAMAWLYVGLVAMLTEFGIGTAVVSIKDLSDAQVRQLHTVAVLLGAVATFMSLLVAHPAAVFFDEPRLAAVLAVLSTSAILSGFRVVPAALLQKQLRFRRLAGYEAANTLVTAMATLALAGAGMRYWALVLGSLLGVLAHGLLVCGAVRLRFERPQLSQIGAALSFSRDVIVARLSWYVYDNADLLVIGKLLGADLLGAYRLAANFASMPLDRLVSLIGRVAPAVLAAVRDNEKELGRYVLRITEATSLAVFPTGVGLALVASDFVESLLGTRWLQAVGPLQILAAYAIVRGISPVWSQALVAIGDTSFLSRVSALGVIVMPAAFAVGSQWGLSGVALAWVAIHPVVVAGPVFLRVLKRVGLSKNAYLHALAPAIVGTLVMAFVVLATHVVSARLPAGQRLALAIAVGAASYLTVIGLVRGTRLRNVLRTLIAAMPKSE